MGMAGAAEAQAPLPVAAQTSSLVGQSNGAVPGAVPSASSPASALGALPGSTDIPAAPPRRAWTIVPRISLGETLTDNVAPTSGVKRSDQVTEISPGIRIDGDTARLKLHLDYQLRQLFYAQESGRQNTQNYLNSFGTLEAVDKWLFVDVSGVVRQQEISPFRQQSASNTTVNSNRVETSSFRVSPFVRGRLAGNADYELRYDRSTTHSNSSLVTDVDTEEWGARIKGTTPLSTFGWALEASRKNVDYSNGRDNEADRLRGLLSYQFDPEFRISISGGRERNDFSSATKETRTTHGYGFDWLPTPRTQVSAFRERRFFGDGHIVTVSHRTPRTALSFTDSRDVAVLPSRFGMVGLGSIHDLIFAQLSSSIPDPVERSRYVDKLLQEYGLSPDVVVTRGFLTTRVSLQRRQEISYSLQGARNILTLSAARTEHEGLGSAGTDQIFENFRNIRQRGVSISLSHRLTPLSSLNVAASRQNSSGSSGTNQTSELKSLHISFSTRLGPRTTASLGARRALFDSTITTPYTENALIGGLTAQF